MQGFLERSRGRAYPLSWHLIALAIAALVPFLVFAAALIHWRAQADINESQQKLLSEARSLANAFDQEIGSSIRALKALTADSSFKNRDWKNYQSNLAEALKGEPVWLNIILHNEKSEPIVSALVPYGEKIPPPIEAKSVQEVFKLQRAVVGPIARGKERYAFAVRIPILEGNRTIYSLSAVISVEALKSFLKHEKNEWARTLLDSNNIIAMRSRDPEKYVGKLGNPSTIEALAKNDEGVVLMNSLDNVRIYLAFRKSSLTSWHSVVSVPEETLASIGNRTWLIVLGSALSLFLIFGTIIFVYASRITRMIQSATSGVRQIASGQIPQLKATSILEVEQLRASLTGASELLRANDQAKREFLANVSHEIRTPLSAVLGFSELMIDEVTDPAERRNYAKIISRNGRQLSTLISDILDYSKMESGNLTVEKIPTSIRETLNDVVNVTEREARNKKLAIAVEPIDDALPSTISSDPTRLYQVLSNLILNAIKFTTSGEVRVAVRKVDLNGELAVCFEVSDTGIGMSEEQKAKLFHPFTQGDSTFRRRFGGSGLGLALSRRLCELMGGDLSLVRSEPGRGSTFQMIIPASLQSLERFKEIPEEKQPLLLKELVGLRILAAEDSRDNQILLERYLKSQGVEVEFAFNGEEAIEQVLRNNYDLVLMDIQMPVLDGYSATQRLRALGYRLPIIAVTAHALPEERERSLREGCDGHVVKPIDRKQLYETIRKLVHR